ncbi:acyclic terpene utilization AtuA family protein [Variovorax ureilyticus]|uniref:Acyclic terpene utilization AtuA family protein n=1 Tax=Variovorax ureilyticus TaxID=1836198 RepID=A0ABU8VLT4_9BURK
MKETIRIGGAGGFWGDSVAALEQLVLRSDVDYIMSDYLAELTMAILAKQKDRNASAGFATDFVSLSLKPVLREVVRRGIRIVVNAGGMNPQGCAEALRALAANLEVPLKIGVVEGDDLMARAAELRAAGTVEMFTGQPIPAQVTSMNAYLGAFPIAKALEMGADVVITGRCADSALALGPLIHEFGWAPDDYDRLAAGSMVGHILECGTQTTGGLFTDWEQVPGREELGFPIVECNPDGVFDITKPEGTGGLITPLVVAEQLLYEVGDPANYLLPDVTVDLRHVTLKQCGPNRVRLAGLRGRPPTDTYKVSATYLDGYRATATLTMIGRGAAGKARLIGNAILNRTRALMTQDGLGDYSETNIELLGTEEATFGLNARQLQSREVVLRIAVRHRDEAALQIFGRELAPFGTSGTPGTTGFSGRPKPTPVYRLFSFLVPKRSVEVSASVDQESSRIAPSPPASWQAPAASQTPEFANVAQSTVRMTLRSLAVARSGDKADISHLAVIARSPDFYPLLRHVVTIDAVANYLSHLVNGRVERYDVPGIHAVNFMLHDSLAGGGTASLRSDSLGKAFAEILLDLEIDVPTALKSHPHLWQG